MARDTRTNLKTHFQTGDIPTQGNYADFIDSKFNLVDQNSGSLFLTGSVNISASNSTDVFKVESVSSISLKSSPAFIQNYCFIVGNDIITIFENCTPLFAYIYLCCFIVKFFFIIN